MIPKEALLMQQKRDLKELGHWVTQLQDRLEVYYNRLLRDENNEKLRERIKNTESLIRRLENELVVLENEIALSEH